MRSSDEIKKGLECCADSGGTCEECPYADGECRAFEQLASDALALIQKLQEEVSKYEEGYDALTKIIKRLEAERDALYEEVRRCLYCIHVDGVLDECNQYCASCEADCPCKECDHFNKFEWRGVQKEE